MRVPIWLELVVPAPGTAALASKRTREPSDDEPLGSTNHNRVINVALLTRPRGRHLMLTLMMSPMPA